MFIEGSANVFLWRISGGAKYLIPYAAPKEAEWLMLIPRL